MNIPSLQKKTRRPKHKAAGAVIMAPRITEKGTILAEKNAYIFLVSVHANKKEIARAIEELFKVKPRAITVVRTTGKRKYTRGTNRFGHGATTKKAYIFLKKGESIDFA